MSDPLELVHRAYAAFARRDFDAVEALSAPDVEFTSLVMESEGTTYRGHEGLRSYLTQMVEVLPDWRPEIETVEQHGDEVLVKARVQATPTGGSVPVEQVMWQVVRVRDDRATHWAFFRTEEEARAALGA